MLRICTAVLAAVLLAIGAPGAQATSNATCTSMGRCAVDARGSLPTADPSTSKEAPQQSPTVERTCSFEGRTVPCTNAHGTWVHSISMWCRPLDEPPPLSDAVWNGRTDGSIQACTRPILTSADPGFTVHRWLPPGSGAEPPPNPEQIAWRLLARIQLEPIEIGTDSELDPPRDDYLSAVVGGHVWLWVENPTRHTWGPIADSMSERGMSVEISARAREVVWDMGDGTRFSCGLGKKAPRERLLSVASPSCGHVYEHMGRYTVTATTHWDVRWSGGGRSGVIEHSTTAEGDLNVGEAQVVITGYGES